MNRWSVRTRLSVIYGLVFMAVGVVLVVINYLLLMGVLPQPAAFVAAVPGYAIPDGVTTTARMQTVDTVADYRASTIQTMLLTSGIALLAAGAIAALMSWYIAGRVLRPVHTITATARRLGAESLNRRIYLDGPDDELKELANTFDGMLDRLASAFDSQTHFVANASHELRTPLAVQRTLVEVAMADPKASPELRRLGEHLLVTNERSERLIEGLLVLARSDRGLRGRVPVRLDQVAETVLLGSIGLADQYNVTIKKNLRPRTVAGDPVLLERLITNLVHNAIRYNVSDGSVSVEIADSPALRVVNTGPVVPVEALPGLFEPFRRLERTSTSGGSGLGLSIVRSVVKAHDGSIGVAARPSGGLDLRVDLPPAAYATITPNRTIPAST
ncbi:ATP-binding protein [Kibdelosporangium philippinense]|uniref:histidine kinase n=1 Tax=Kibdelosporangium philippinense TaxID=211113 RepID=A0ABS8ZN98_9PSEU|nr:ATP-binding protein [Kibdelosporangium philippinense]MCE7009022.1 ATP-binding protein [Kibdelosporangium philippinense]